ncbi:MAG: M20/M25/M40 family metallo-hydrolase [Firmicutes bacterium]|nr:M20/M25/M40 family metallo-hydrolase [Bacillota bacterium]
MINESRILDNFLELVQIDSESGHELAMGNKLIELLETIPGMQVRVESAGSFYKTNGFNVIGWLEGTLPGEPILLSAHMDTVVPGKGIKPQIRDGFVYSDGTTVLAADDKAGIAEIFEAIRTITEQDLPHRSTEIIFSVGEETGLNGAKSIDVSKLHAKQGYVLDTGGHPGRIVNCQPGQYSIEATITGRSAHAGNQPEEGISAIQVASCAIAKMRLLRVDELTTCNIGSIVSEYPTNIVPEKCSVKMEVRSRDAKLLDKQEAHVRRCFENACRKFGAQLEYSKRTKYLSYKIEDDASVIREYAESCKRQGVEPRLDGAGGGSDANIYNQQGLQCVVVSTGMSGNHAVTEKLNIAEMNKAAEILADVLTH